MIALDQYAEQAAQLRRMAALADGDGRTDLGDEFRELAEATEKDEAAIREAAADAGLAQTFAMSAYTLGRCAAKGCKHSTRSEAGRMAGECPEHGAYRLERVWAYTVPAVRCGARCRGAVGPSCDCSCGGANHGAAHGR